MPEFTVIDLGTFAPDYAGVRVRVLANPTVGQRQQFLDATYAPGQSIREGNPWIAAVAMVLGVEGYEAARAALDGMPLDAMRWLFVPTLYEDEHVRGQWHVIAPYVVQLWDERASARIKTFASRSGGQA